MSRRKSRLGKGLEAIINQGLVTSEVEYPIEAVDQLGEGALSALEPPETEHANANDSGVLLYLPVETLQPGRYQPRRALDPQGLSELADSIKQQGVMQPIVVRKIEGEKCEIVAGERRWRASQLAGLDRVPCIVRTIDDQSTVALSLIENIQREDLTPIEEALALQRLQQAFDLTHQQVAESVGKSRTTVTNLIRLLALNEEVKNMLDCADLEMGHARALLRLPEAKQPLVARHVVAKELTVRQTETYVKRIVEQDKEPKNQPVKSDPNIQRLEHQLSSRLGTQVKIKHNAKGVGALVLKYRSLEELDGILNHIR